MLPDPLHPMVVHFPIVLTVLLPGVALAALLLGRRRRPRAAWLAAVVAGALLVASAWVALATGEAQEDRVEAVVAEAPLETHEHAAERFLTASVATLVLLGLGLLPRAAGSAARLAGVAAAVVLLGLGWSVGHSGGELVYRHGAASAYTGTGAGSAGGAGRLGVAGDVAPSPARRVVRRDGDDDGDER